MIEIKNLDYSLAKKSILTNLTQKFPQNKVIALIGPNGAGKSSLLALLGRLQKATFGEITIDQCEIQQWNHKKLAQKLAILRQTNHLPLQITVEELVSFGRYPYCRNNLSKIDKKIIQQAIEAMQLKDFQQQRIDQLSGGQLQRALIALVLAQDTPYLLLDEPLNNLDLTHANQLMNYLKVLVQQFNKTIIVVLHDINFAANFADYIIAMKDGKIFTQGTTEQIIQSEILTNIFDFPITIHQIHDKKFCLYFA